MSILLFSQTFHTASLEKALSYFNEPLPLSTTELNKQLNRVPLYLYSDELCSAINTKNQEIIFSHFCRLSERVG